jgi:hypothetical protein
LVRGVPIADARLLRYGERVQLAGGPCTVALDGEREIELRRGEGPLEVRLDPNGPRVVDIDEALREGALRTSAVTEALRV